MKVHAVFVFPNPFPDKPFHCTFKAILLYLAKPLFFSFMICLVVEQKAPLVKLLHSNTYFDMQIEFKINTTVSDNF